MDLEKLIQLLIKEEGGTKEQYHLLLNTIANHESKGDPTIHQLGGGPGRGLYQFEEGDNMGGKTAANRLINYLNEIGNKVPQWLKNTQKSTSLDASTLTPKQQSMLFLGDKKGHPTANLANLWNGKETIEDFWAKYHWSGEKKDEFARRKSFKTSANNFDASKPIPYETKLQNMESKNLIKPKDGINIPSKMNYKLNLDSFNIKEPKSPMIKDIILNDVNNRNIAALGGNINQSQEIGEFNSINSGGSHEQNPNGGVPQGVGQNGKLNTIEENETTYQFKEGKYVFSNRIKI